MKYKEKMENDINYIYSNSTFSVIRTPNLINQNFNGLHFFRYAWRYSIMEFDFCTKKYFYAMEELWLLLTNILPNSWNYTDWHTTIDNWAVNVYKIELLIELKVKRSYHFTICFVKQIAARYWLALIMNYCMKPTQTDS